MVFIFNDVGFNGMVSLTVLNPYEIYCIIIMSHCKQHKRRKDCLENKESCVWKKVDGEWGCHQRTRVYKKKVLQTSKTQKKKMTSTTPIRVRKKSPKTPSGTPPSLKRIQLREKWLLAH